jgi:hypothetical protein
VGERAVKRSTKIELYIRVSEVIGLLASGATRADILQYASKTGRFADREGDPWDVSARMVDTYISKAYEEYTLKDERARAREKARANIRYTTIFAKAAAKGKFDAATRAEKERCALLGLNDPIQLGPVLFGHMTDEEVIELARRLLSSN